MIRQLVRIEWDDGSRDRQHRLIALTVVLLVVILLFILA